MFAVTQTLVDELMLFRLSVFYVLKTHAILLILGDQISYFMLAHVYSSIYLHSFQTFSSRVKLKKYLSNEKGKQKVFLNTCLIFSIFLKYCTIISFRKIIVNTQFLTPNLN